MNELKRQHYLSALGVDTYMPRWHLPFAPLSAPCEMSDVSSDPAHMTLQPKIEINKAPIQIYKSIDIENTIVSPVNKLMGNIIDATRAISSISKPINAANILAQLDSKPVAIDGFSLSIWRPSDSVMIVDARNTKLALPTELFLNNILRVILSIPAKIKEEVLRWPMIENSFTKCTANDARLELQTWLSVQHEIKPIRHLWLMGANAANYLLHEEVIFEDSIFQQRQLADSSIKALVLPSLNDLLQNPRTKQKLFSAIRQYHSVLQ